jgi:hypothetical protein
MKTYVGVEVRRKAALSLTSALNGSECSASNTGTRCFVGWVGPRVVLDTMKRDKSLLLLGIESCLSSRLIYLGS